MKTTAERLSFIFKMTKNIKEKKIENINSDILHFTHMRCIIKVSNNCKLYS